MFDEHKEIYLFFADLRPNSITTLQVTWTRNVSQVTHRIITIRFVPVATSQVTWIRNVSKVTKVKITNLHNLSYVVLFFVISFTDCIFDAFNCWNHCIF